MEQPPDFMELKVISCKDLKAFNFFQKLNIYVVVSIVYEEDDDEKKKKKKKQQQKQKTLVDREGDGNPEWNHLMRLDLKEIFSSSSGSSSLLLLVQFDLLSEGTILGDKTIGRVRVPIEDLINGGGGGGAVRFVSYQVRTTDGIPNGVLDFSFKPIFNHNPHHYNSFGNEAVAAPPVPIGGRDDVPLIYPPMQPSTNNYYPPPPPPLLPAAAAAVDDGSYVKPESYYPRIDQFHYYNPSQEEEIHYPTTFEIHNSPPPSKEEFHNPSQLYYHPPQHPQPHVDYHHHQLPPYHHHHHHPLPQVAYYPPPPPPPPTQPLFYPPTPTTDPFVRHGDDEFGRVGNPNHPVAYHGYPNYYWASARPIHW